MKNPGWGNGVMGFGVCAFSGFSTLNACIDSREKFTTLPNE